MTCTLTPDPCASIDEQKRAIKPDGRHQVQAELLLPLVVTRRGEATAPARSTREHVHHDGDARQAREFKIEAHGQIRSRMTRSPATVKRKRRRIGLPGKLPLTFAITVLCAQMVCHETGSVVHSYLAMTSAFHAAIAALPQCSRGQSLCPALDALLTWAEQRPTQRQQR
ncbi:hypothetical protein WK22_26400 [Burkholderia multivorans]|nr:hypothetical protein WK22_26400 [Burkholderia multivorans]